MTKAIEKSIENNKYWQNQLWSFLINPLTTNGVILHDALTSYCTGIVSSNFWQFQDVSTSTSQWWQVVSIFKISI